MYQLFQISGSLGFDHRLYCKGMTGIDKEKQERFVAPGDDPEEDSSGNSSVDEENTEKEEEENSDSGRGRVLMEGGEDILEDLTPCDVRVLVHSEEELSQCETFERIFPTTETGHYLQYMETNYYDLLLLAWERRHDKNRQRGREMLAAFTSKVAKNRFRQNFDLNSFHPTRGCTLRFPLVRSARRVRLPKIP